MRSLLTALLALTLCACATNDHYREYLEAHAADQARVDAQLADLRASAAECTDDTCRVSIAGFAALAASQSKRQGPTQYVPQTSTAAKIGLALVGQLAPIANAAVSWHQSDNSRRTSEAQYEFLGGVVSDVAAVANGAQPNITVGGNLGDTTTFGDDFTGGDRTETNIGRDSTGGDHADGSVIGDENRFESPGPFDNSNDGDDCTGDGCQAPVPDPIGEG